MAFTAYGKDTEAIVSGFEALGGQGQRSRLKVKANVQNVKVTNVKESVILCVLLMKFKGELLV